MKKSKLVIILLCLVLALTACGGNKPQESSTAVASQETTVAVSTEQKVTWDIKNADENFPLEQYVADEKAKWNIGRNVDLTWYFNYNHHYGTKPWTEYECLKVAADITGINVTGTIPTGDGAEKVRLMMASNELPDLITLGYGDPLASELIDGGYVYSLDDLMDKYIPEYKSEFPESLRISGTYEKDGKLYSFAGVSQPEWLLKQKTDPGANGNFSYNVRKDLWIAMGKPSIATPDELENTLRLFKKTYPTLNGKTSVGIVGYSAGQGAMMTMGNSFGIYGGNVGNNLPYYDESTKIATVKYLNPNYPVFIAYMNKLFREGLLDPEIFIKDDQKVIETLSTNGFMMPYVWHAADPANAILDAKDPESHFIAIPPMSATGKPFAYPGNMRIGGAVMTFITQKCTDPEAAIKLVRYGLSPTGTMQVSQGTPGKHWISKDGIFTRPQAEADELSKDAGAYLNRTGVWDYYSLWYPPMAGKRNDSPDRVAFDIPNSVPYSFDSSILAFNMSPNPANDEGVAAATIEKIADSQYKAIMAKTAEESANIITKMINDIKAAKDFDKLQQFLTNQYQKNVEKFGAPIY